MTATPSPPPPPPASPPSGAPASAGGLTCPACGASVPAGTRFCPSCGASLTATSQSPPAAGSSATGSSAPVDIRQTVDADRGVLKRLQLMVPGFRGYRQMEDIRAADSQLRIQVANQVDRILASLQDTRAAMSRMNQYAGLTDLATILSDLQVLSGRIRHAEQGYSGISANIRFQQSRLDQLYEYDYGFVQASDQLAAMAPAIQAASQQGNLDALRNSIQALRTQVQVLQNAFAVRVRAVEGIMVQ
jgi:predicted amidophosphoribosyltransferase